MKKMQSKSVALRSIQSRRLEARDLAVMAFSRACVCLRYESCLRMDEFRDEAREEAMSDVVIAEIELLEAAESESDEKDDSAPPRPLPSCAIRNDPVALDGAEVLEVTLDSLERD